MKKKGKCFCVKCEYCAKKLKKNPTCIKPLRRKRKRNPRRRRGRSRSRSPVRSRSRSPARSRSRSPGRRRKRSRSKSPE